MTLKECYDEVAKITIVNEEPFTVVECVDHHRKYWRPKRVHTILLAESHVFTDRNECAPMKPRAPIHLQGAATEDTSQFVRLIYCLGYGENEYAGFERKKKNPGTWQFWKIFSSCVAQPSEESFARILKGGNRSYENRLTRKIELLHQLKEKGVWLVDASVVALYRPGGHKPSLKIREKIIECCWDNYIGDQIASADPHSIIVIGDGVKKALSSRLARLSQLGVEAYEVPQPQKHMSNSEIAGTHQLYFDVCQRAMKSRTTG